jgi:hypothetical protein
MATSFGHKDHHQAGSQKLTKAGTNGAKWSIYFNEVELRTCPG